MSGILASYTFANGVWVASGQAPPDTLVPTAMLPPGVSSPGGFIWCQFGPWKLNSSGYAAPQLTSPWVLVPLPVGQIVGVQGPGGSIVPTVCVGSIWQMKSAAGTVNGKATNNVAIPGGGWYQTWDTPPPGTTALAEVQQGPPIATVPVNPPNGYSGGTWAKSMTTGGLWVYDNGQLSAGSNAGLWAVLGLGVVGVGGTAAYLA